MAYTVERRSSDSGPVVHWSDEDVQESADDLESRTNSRRATERSEICNWLSQLLAEGPVPATEVHEAAAATGFSRATLRRAFRQLRGQALKDGRGGWAWKLPEQDAHNLCAG